MEPLQKHLSVDDLASAEDVPYGCATIPRIYRGGIMLAELFTYLRSTWYNKYAVIALCAAFALGAYQGINWSSLNAADWGTWVGSIGTVFTLIGTIWLATAEKRKQRRQELDRAFVAAASLDLKLQKMHDTLQNSVEHFADPPGEAGYFYDVFARLILDEQIWSDDEILPLIALPDRVCARLASSRSLIGESVHKMTELANTATYSFVEATKDQRDAEIRALLIRSRDGVSYCLEQCRNFTKVVNSAVAGCSS
jgi:hypothetical protein